jgi:alpha-amylase/alpha-mannosidase (GH57 family)
MQYICIHGHFYQPPRENAWLEAIELQDSAYPYHDWNERITAECYACNGSSRILDGYNRILRIVNNYSRISFNIGPTLLSWMEAHAPLTYQSIIEADALSQKIFSGHGSALAQAYNHMIMPLANRRDKYTQVQWGIRDFEYRFGRMPEGMWLAETAVDLETLDIMAEAGIKFTVLSPYQAGRVRNAGTTEWSDVSDGHVDPKRVYEQQLPSGRTIALFFYDGPISQGVAFEGLLIKGENLANRLIDAFDETASMPQLVHIATDGETYGHHHRNGDMALAYALDYIESNHLANLTIYGEYLEKHPPTYEVEIIENTSWSCYHGIERWRSNCGCNSGMQPKWHQRWRAPLRDALDWLRDTVNPRYEKKAHQLLKDPWLARDDYINVILDRSHENVEHFLERHAARNLSASDQTLVLKLMELQRHALLMYTSCGWFFDEISGIETIQVMQYAARVIQLASETIRTKFEPDDIDPGFRERLKRAESNIPQYGNGARCYEKFVEPAMVDLKKVLAHYAVSSLFDSHPQPANEHVSSVYCYSVECRDCQILEYGKTRLAIGQARVTSTITRESAELCYGVLHFGDHNITGGVRENKDNIYQAMVKEVTDAFLRADLPETIRLLDKHFLQLMYSLRTLFRDEQRMIVRYIMETSMEEAESVYRQVYNSNAPMMRFLMDLNIPLPEWFRTSADFVLNADMRRAFEHEDIDADRIQAILDEVHRGHIELHTTELEYTLRKTLEWMEERMFDNPANLPLLRKFEVIIDLTNSLPFELDLWKIQNIYYDMQQRVYPDFLVLASRGNETAHTWLEHFISLGRKLGFQVYEMEQELKEPAQRAE